MERCVLTPEREPPCVATIIAEHDVLRLQVSVDDPFLVQMTQGHRDLSQIETSNSKKKRGKKGS